MKIETLNAELDAMQLPVADVTSMRGSLPAGDGAIVFGLQLKPQPKQRPRLGAARTFTPDETRKAELAVKRAAKAAMGDRLPLGGPIRVDLHFVVPMATYAKADDVVAAAWTLLKRAWAHVGGKGNSDIDNLAKLVLDACNELCFADDVQIVSLHVYKVHDAGYVAGATAVCIRSCATVSPPRFGFFAA